MKVGERLTPMLAACSAVASLACCLPIGGASLFGLGTILVVAGTYQRWLLPLSAILLAAGVALVWRSRRLCHRTSKLSLGILALSAAIVLCIWLAPQAVAGLLAHWGP